MIDMPKELYILTLYHQYIVWDREVLEAFYKAIEQLGEQREWYYDKIHTHITYSDTYDKRMQYIFNVCLN